jgi:gamma-glutamylcyclotransferase
VELRGFELKWHKRSRKDGSGKCDVVKAAEETAVVCGVLYEIDNDEKRALDRAEGVGYGYDQTELRVFRGGQPVDVVAYIATDIDAALKPLDWYHAHVVDGAVEHGLPAEYISGLKSVGTIRTV